MNKLLHKIKHLLGLNYGYCDAFYEGDRLMMSFKCNICGQRSGIHEIDEIIENELLNQ